LPEWLVACPKGRAAGVIPALSTGPLPWWCSSAIRSTATILT